jgi:hypothetical protein
MELSLGILPPSKHGTLIRNYIWRGVDSLEMERILYTENSFMFTKRALNTNAKSVQTNYTDAIELDKLGKHLNYCPTRHFLYG